MLTWRDFYQTLGFDILKDRPFIKDVIVVYRVDIDEVLKFLESKGFQVKCTLPVSDIKYTPSCHRGFPYSLCKISRGINSCCLPNKPLNIYDFLIYLASSVYFHNWEPSSLDEVTDDNYRLSITSNSVGGHSLRISIEKKDRSIIKHCFYSELRFALNSGTTSK